jgi:enamine deaminase RidA (YjgF/YER057c/UK114 family)
MKTHINPRHSVHQPSVEPDGRRRSPRTTIDVGGQNAITATGDIVGDNVLDQTRQVPRNIQAALDAAGATLADLVSLPIAVVEGHALEDGYAAFQELLDLCTDWENESMSFRRAVGLSR